MVYKYIRTSRRLVYISIIYRLEHCLSIYKYYIEVFSRPCVTFTTCSYYEVDKGWLFWKYV